MPDLSVVIVSYNTRSILRRCLDELASAAVDYDVEVIVVDNGSTDGTLGMLAEQPDVAVRANDANVGFAAANNQGLRMARAPYALLLNSDAFIGRDALTRGLELLRSRPEVGLVGVRLLNPDGTIQAEHGAFPNLWTDIRTSAGLDRLSRPTGETREPRAVDWVQGACMFARVAALSVVGLLDTRFFMYSEEVEWCRRFWERGWQVWYMPNATVTHIGGASSAGLDLRRRAALYRGRLGLRRRFSGPVACGVLWACMLLSLAGRVGARAAARALTRRQVGRQTPRSDWQLLCAIARMDPLARWVIA